MTDDEYVMELSEYCFNACEVLKDMLQGTNLVDLDESERVAMQNLGRCVD